MDMLTGTRPIVDSRTRASTVQGIRVRSKNLSIGERKKETIFLEVARDKP